MLFLPGRRRRDRIVVVASLDVRWSGGQSNHRHRCRIHNSGYSRYSTSYTLGVHSQPQHTAIVERIRKQHTCRAVLVVEEDLLHIKVAASI